MTIEFDKSTLKTLSTRELQAYGAACLAKFCADKGISSPDVDQLVAHLLGLLTCEDLPGWESTGARLGLAGRGDRLPMQLEAAISPDLLGVLRHLVESVVEIGVVDMYGAETDQPLGFALRAVDILESQGVLPPAWRDLFPMREAQDVQGWGRPVSSEQYEHAREWVRSRSGRAARS